jgi:hypothetical protein
LLPRGELVGGGETLTEPVGAAAFEGVGIGPFLTVVVNVNVAVEVTVSVSVMVAPVAGFAAAFAVWACICVIVTVTVTGRGGGLFAAWSAAAGGVAALEGPLLLSDPSSEIEQCF